MNFYILKRIAWYIIIGLILFSMIAILFKDQPIGDTTMMVFGFRLWSILRKILIIPYAGLFLTFFYLHYNNSTNFSKISCLILLVVMFLVSIIGFGISIPGLDKLGLLLIFILPIVFLLLIIFFFTFLDYKEKNAKNLLTSVFLLFLLNISRSLGGFIASVLLKIRY